MNKKWLWILIPAALVGLAALIGLGGWIVMQLWNWLAPALFGWKLIGFWQALGLLALCRILFGGWGCHSGQHGKPWESKRECKGKLTPEEREKFRSEMRERWHGTEAPAAGNNRTA
jgi:hypothetical protein